MNKSQVVTIIVYKSHSLGEKTYLSPKSGISSTSALILLLQFIRDLAKVNHSFTS